MIIFLLGLVFCFIHSYQMDKAIADSNKFTKFKKKNKKQSTTLNVRIIFNVFE